MNNIQSRNNDSNALPITVCALYKFTTLKDYKDLRQNISDQLDQRNIRGTLLLAEEGINGTISGTNPAIEEFLNWLQTDLRFAEIDYKLSYHATMPFHRTKVKLKKEIKKVLNCG